LADVARDRRDIRKPLLKRLEIEPGPTDQYRQKSESPGCLDLATRRFEPESDRPWLRSADRAVEPMRNFGLFLGRRSRGQNAKLAINLHRIGIDDDPMPLARQSERERRLAARRRPCDKHCAPLCRHCAWTPSSFS